jgi:hypothetical protein
MNAEQLYLDGLQNGFLVAQQVVNDGQPFNMLTIA